MSASASSHKKRPRVFLSIEIGDPEAYQAAAASHERFLSFWRARGAQYGAPPPPAQLDAASQDLLLEAYASDPASSAAGPALPNPPPTLRAGRLVLELYPEEAPKAVANFLALVRGGVASKLQKGTVLGYRSGRFHRVVRGFVAQAGIMNARLGTGESSFPGGGAFQDDKLGLKLRHDGLGVLSMANGGKPHTNTSQFFLTLSPEGAPQLDGKHVVFGRVVEGAEEVLGRIDAEAGTEDGKPPRAVVVIADCGELE
jgi:peptidylprolyl isomerase